MRIIFSLACSPICGLLILQYTIGVFYKKITNTGSLFQCKSSLGQHGGIYLSKISGDQHSFPLGAYFNLAPWEEFYSGEFHLQWLNSIYHYVKNKLNKKSTSQYIIACVTAGPGYLEQAEQRIARPPGGKTNRRTPI